MGVGGGVAGIIKSLVTLYFLPIIPYLSPTVVVLIHDMPCLPVAPSRFQRLKKSFQIPTIFFVYSGLLCAIEMCGDFAKPFLCYSVDIIVISLPYIVSYILFKTMK